MAIQKRHSSQSSGESSSSSIRRSTLPPPPTKQPLAKRHTLSDGTTAHCVPNSSRPHHRTIPFSDDNNPDGIWVKNILSGGCVQNSPGPNFKAEFFKILFQWPGIYDSSDTPPARYITINPNTKQELAVALCTALHKLYSWASKIPPPVEAVPWTLCSEVRLKDIMLKSIHDLGAGVWVPEFYVLQKY